MLTRSAQAGAIALLALLAARCGDGANYPPLDGCEALMAHCIDDSHFDDLRGLGAVDVETAHAAFRCMLDFYAGDCRSRVGDILECLQGVMDATGCSPCDWAFGEFMHACPPPTPCME